MTSAKTKINPKEQKQKQKQKQKIAKNDIKSLEDCSATKLNAKANLKLFEKKENNKTKFYRCN
jgi:Zn-dependent M16 (insulinase) family peptidase